MLPLVLAGIAVAALVGGCTDDEENVAPSMDNDNLSPNEDASRDGYASDYLDAVSQNDEVDSYTADSDVLAQDFVHEQVEDFSADAAEVLTDASQIADEFISELKDLIEGDETTDTETNPFVPSAPLAEYVADMPCAFPASLSVDESENAVFATCDGGLFRLFKGFAPQWEAFASVEGFPSNHIALGDGNFAVTHFAPDGITIVSGETGLYLDSFYLSSEQIIFSGFAQGYVPNNPSGAVVVGNNICFATSNIDHADMDQSKTTFNPGCFVCLDYLGNGLMDHSFATAYPTSGINPTGMIALGANRFAVLSTNGYDLTAGTTAYLDVCEHPSMECDSIELTDFEGSPITAQMSPSLARTSDGVVRVAVQKPYPQIISVDVESKEMVEWLELGAVNGFVSSVTADGDELFVGDFGVWGQGGKVMFALPSNGWQVLNTPVEGHPGPSTASFGKFYAAITGPEMSDAILYSYDKSSLVGE